MECREALDFVCTEALSQGAEYADAIAGESQSIGLELFESKVKNTEISSSRGLGVRLFSGNCPGYAFTEKFSVESLRQTVRDAISNTRVTDKLHIDFPGPQVFSDIDFGTWNDDLETIEMGQLKAMGLELERVALAADNRVENVPYLGAGRTSSKTWIRSTGGIDCFSRANAVYSGLGVLTSHGKSKKMGTCSHTAFSLDALDPLAMAEKAVERGVELLNASPLQGGQYPVILSKRISPQVFSMYSSPFIAESVQKGQSKLKGMLGKSIASSGLSIICDPHLRQFPGSRLFDGEGIPCRKTVVVEDGILKNYLYNLESAHRENKLSTGHAVRGYSGQVGTGFSNFIVPLGKDDIAELLKAYPRCLYVNSLEGGSGCSSVSGEMSIGIQGFLFENGERKQPVDGMTMSSNFFDMIRLVRGFSNRYSDTLSSVKVPDVLIESMYVAG